MLLALSMLLWLWIFWKRVHTCFLLQWFDRKKSKSTWVRFPDERFLTARLWNLAVNLARTAIVTDVSTKSGEGDIVQLGIWKLYSGKNRLPLLQINLTWRWKQQIHVKHFYPSTKAHSVILYKTLISVVFWMINCKTMSHYLSFRFNLTFSGYPGFCSRNYGSNCHKIHLFTST
jgi:hypothetical protein